MAKEQQVECYICSKLVTKSNLKKHMKLKHGLCSSCSGASGISPVVYAWPYRVLVKDVGTSTSLDEPLTEETEKTKTFLSTQIVNHLWQNTPFTCLACYPNQENHHTCIKDISSMLTQYFYATLKHFCQDNLSFKDILNIEMSVLEMLNDYKKNYAE